MRSALRFLSLALAAATLPACAAGEDDPTLDVLEAELTPPRNAQFSELWGRHGKKWGPRSRLPDFSYAGYEGGDAKIPRFTRVVDIRDYGARPNDRRDDSRALMRAIQDAPRNGVVFVPRGRWRIDRPVELHRSRVVIRGEGSGKRGTVFVIPRPLAKVVPLPAGKDSTYWSHSDGFFRIGGKGSTRKVARLVRDGDGAFPRRGDHWITVDDASGIEPGDFLSLRLIADRALLSHVYNDKFQLRPGDSCVSEELDLPVVVDRVEGRRVRLLQPLRLDARGAWQPSLVRVPLITDVGVEKVRFSFRKGRYAGHHAEPGYNAISMSRVANGWVRNVVFDSADNGILVAKSKWLTFEDLRFAGTRGHHGITLSKTADVLVQNVHFASDMFHELTVTYKAHGNVFRRVSTDPDVRLHLDHHGGYPFENLFTNFGRVGRYSWLSGGGDPCKGPHTGARGTFWNLDGLGVPSRYDDLDGGTEGEAERLPWISLQTNLVGKLAPGTKSNKTRNGRWVEDKPRLWPRDIYRAQFLRRQGMFDDAE